MVSVKDSWIYGIVSFFNIGIAYLIFNPIINVYLVPILKNHIEHSNIDASTQALILSRYVQYSSFFNLLPFILLFGIVVFMIIVSIRTEADTMQY